MRKKIEKPSKHQKQIKRKQKQRLKRIRQLAKALKLQHKNQQDKHRHRQIVPYISKHGMHFNKFQPRYPLQSFKNPQTHSWRLVKTCRLQSLSDVVFSIQNYNEQGDYFVIRSPDTCGFHYYNRYQLEPYIKKKNRKISDYINQASKIISQGQK